MKRRNYVMSILLLTLVLVQASVSLQADSKSTEISVNNETTTAELEQPFIDSVRKYAIFFKSKESMNNFIAENNVKLAFEHLKVVILNDLLSQRDHLEKTSGVKHVFDVTNSKFYRIEPPEENPLYMVAGTKGIKFTQDVADVLNTSFLWSLGYEGDNIIAYDVDTGINVNHVDFEGRIMSESKSFVTKDLGYSSNDPDIDDFVGHGTHTAGIMAGDGTGNPEYIGMAPNAQILVGKIGDASQEGAPATIESIVAAFEYALELKENGTIVDVINFSYGGGDQEGQNAQEALVKELFLNGILFSTSAGNEGPNYYTVGSPASEAQSLAVGATKSGGSGQASFSSVGPTADGYMKPDVSAPGVGITSCYIDGSTAYETLDGTSMAAPAITGSTGVLINALKSESIPYDPGLVKTALMLSATDPGSDYLQLGAGTPNLGHAFDLIKNAYNGGQTNSSGFPALIWAIPELNIPYYQTMKQGFYAEMYVKSVSSTPWNDLAPVLTGSITNIATLNTIPETEPWEKNYQLVFNVSDDAPLGEYTGVITFETASGETAETQISVTVEEGLKKIFYAKMLTNWGNDHTLGQYIYFIEALKNKGIAVNEYPSGEITAEMLNGHDAIWIADPFNYYYPSASATSPRTYRVLSNDELLAIHDFVEAGGGLFIDFNGKRKFEGYTVGNNISMINELVAPYDMEAYDGFYSMPTNDPELAVVFKNHRISSGIKKVDHYGTHMYSTGDAVEVMQYDGKPTTVAYENTNGGRVVVSTTNFYLDTVGYLENYNDDTDNARFASNIIDWLTVENQIIVSSNMEDDKISFNISVSPDDAELYSYIEIIDVNDTSTTENITLISTGTGTYEYELVPGEDAIYIVSIGSPYDLYVGYFVYDGTPPYIKHPNWENGTAMPEQSFIDFAIVDVFSLMSYAEVSINGEAFSVTITSTSVTFRVYKYHLKQEESILEIFANDTAGNILETTLVIYKTAAPTEPTDDGTDESPIALFFAILSLLALTSIISVYKRKIT